MRAGGQEVGDGALTSPGPPGPQESLFVLPRAQTIRAQHYFSPKSSRERTHRSYSLPGRSGSRACVTQTLADYVVPPLCA